MDVYPIRVLIADDEAPARRELRRLLSMDPQLLIIGESDSGVAVFEQALIHKPDIIFLDIQMPGMNGIEVAQAFLRHDYYPLIIFITAYDEYAIEAFELHAVDYILKPVREERFAKMLERVHQRISSQSAVKDNEKYLRELLLAMSSMNNQRSCKERISVYKGDKIIPVCVDTILYAEAKGRSCTIYTDDAAYPTTYIMSELQSILHPPNFFLSHRSFIINLDKIESIDIWFNGAYRVKMQGREELIPVSRGNAAEFRALMHMS